MRALLLREASALRKQLSSWRRHFHQYPEIGFEEERTARYIRAELKRLGLAPRPPSVGTDVVVDLTVPAATRTVALRADIDALPVQEESRSSYRSRHPGCAHLCGHDAHAAMLLGAAALLRRHQGDLGVNVRLLFQPAEERPPGGAQALIDAGLLGDVDEIFGLHVDSRLPVGVVASRPGAIMAAADGFEVRFIGRGGHAASPHLNRDPVPAAAQAVLALQTIVSRYTDPTEPVVVSVCVVEGGTAFNVTPEVVRFAGTVRTVSRRHRLAVPRLMKRILTGVARSAGVRVELLYSFYYGPTVNHRESVAYAAETVVALTGRRTAYRQATLRMGAEDFACYLERVPGAFIFLGSRGPAARTRSNHHSPRFDIDERVLPLGAALAAGLALGQGKRAAGSTKAGCPPCGRDSTKAL
jgi:amidohydrolase